MLGLSRELSQISCRALVPQTLMNFIRNQVEFACAAYLVGNQVCYFKNKC